MNVFGFNSWNMLQNKVCSNNPCAENNPKGNIRNVFSVSFSIHWLYGPCRTLASFKINFQSSLSLVIFLQLLIPIFFGSFSTIPFLTFQLVFFLLGYS